MARIIKALVSSVLISVLLSGSSLATPSQLFRKTIAVSWLFSGTDTDGKRGRTDIKYMIYVSTTGRLFTRKMRTTIGLGRELSDTDDFEPGEGKTSDGFPRELRFEGRHLIGKMQFSSGAILLTIDFDPAFRSCTVNAVYGKQNGAPIRVRAMGGVRDWVLAGASAQTCSIKEGNAFAGE